MPNPTSGQGGALRLILAIKRGLSRNDDAKSKAADDVTQAKRPNVLTRHRMTCAGCAYTARQPKHLDVHHLDDNHHNNADENLTTACHTCHPYQHIGQTSHRTDQWAEGIGKRTSVAHIPELSPADVNLLQRAIGAAMLDDSSRADAQEIYECLLERCDSTADRFSSCFATDFAACMASLSDQEYADRGRAIEDQRLMFSEVVLMKLGREFAADYPSRAVASWPTLAENCCPSSPSPGGAPS